MGGSATPSAGRLLGQLGREDGFFADRAHRIDSPAHPRFVVEKNLQGPALDSNTQLEPATSGLTVLTSDRPHRPCSQYVALSTARPGSGAMLRQVVVRPRNQATS